VLGLHAGDRRCSAWVAIAPRGFLCASDLEPTSAAPGGADLPTVAPGQLLPGAYYDVVADDTPAYRDVAAARDGAPTELLSTHVLVRGGDLVEIDGQDYLPTHRGLVPASELRPLDPSAFVGLDLRAQPAPWPLAFVGPDHDAIVRAAPRRDAPVVGQRAARAVVWVRSERPGWVELGPDAWVAAGELRVVRPAAPPPDLAADAPWLDVDLDQQTLVAYVGATPMYVTLVSTGRRRGTTPPGLYRIVAKAATTRMTAEAHEQNQYDVGAVPWALRFRRGLYLHAAYWHDRFGARKSHGCINLAPRDARALYDWATPSAAGLVRARDPHRSGRRRAHPRRRPPRSAVVRLRHRAPRQEAPPPIAEPRSTGTGTGTGTRIRNRNRSRIRNRNRNRSPNPGHRSRSGLHATARGHALAFRVGAPRFVGEGLCESPSRTGRAARSRRTGSPCGRR
jgi:hypothetical protein